MNFASSTGMVAGLWLAACSGTLDDVEILDSMPPDAAAFRPPRAVGQAGWGEIHTGGVTGTDCPMASEDAALAYDATRHLVFLYGGKDDDDVTRNELWAFNVVTRLWIRIDSSGPQPPPREDHTLVLDEVNDALVLFGGESGSTSERTWLFDLRGNRWSELTDDSAPSLEGHCAIHDPLGRRMVVFGGMSQEKARKAEKTVENRTWILDLDGGSPRFGTWAELEPSEPMPSPRREHRGIYDPVRHRMLVFGGRLRSSSSFLDDTWALDLERGIWSEIETHGERPDPIRQTVLGYDADTNLLTVFGGEVAVRGGDPDEFRINQVWVLDLESGRWSDRTPYPRAMYDHAGVFVPDYGGTLIYGGSSHWPEKEHSTWLLQVR